jgi:hypothetical protein
VSNCGVIVEWYWCEVWCGYLVPDVDCELWVLVWNCCGYWCCVGVVLECGVVGVDVGVVVGVALVRY